MNTFKNLEEAEELASNEEGELKELAEMELPELRQQRDDLKERIKTLLVPKDPRDERNVIIEIRAGTGGDEAGLFCFRPAAHVLALCRPA